MSSTKVPRPVASLTLSTLRSGLPTVFRSDLGLGIPGEDSTGRTSAQLLRADALKRALEVGSLRGRGLIPGPFERGNGATRRGAHVPQCRGGPSAVGGVVPRRDHSWEYDCGHP